MNATLARRARKALATTLAAGALTAGLGLATTATAEAGTGFGKICISNMKGTAKITSKFDPKAPQTFTAPVALPGDGTSCVFRNFSTIVTDEVYDKTAFQVNGFGLVELATTDPNYASATVTLGGTVAPVPLKRGADSTSINVPIKLNGSGNYVIVENVVDARGDHSETTITFRADFVK